MENEAKKIGSLAVEAGGVFDDDCTFGEATFGDFEALPVSVTGAPVSMVGTSIDKKPNLGKKV